jgi:hypothetical protein
MKPRAFIFRLDRHRRFVSGPRLALDQFLWADRLACDCPDRLFCRRGFRISSDFQRQSLARRSDSETVRGVQIGGFWFLGRISPMRREGAASNGQDAALSRLRWEFDSPRCYQVMDTQVIELEGFETELASELCCDRGGDHRDLVARARRRRLGHNVDESAVLCTVHESHTAESVMCPVFSFGVCGRPGKRSARLDSMACAMGN